MSDAEPLLRIQGLHKQLGGTDVLRGLGLTVHRGDVYGLLGLNGAGKSTTLRCLTGLLRPDAGTITLAGRELRPGRPEDRRGLGAMVEGPAFFLRLGARRNLERVCGLTEDLGADEVDRLLDLVGLTDAADRPARTYSLGMRQRLGIAMALAGDPDLIVLDEPSNGLDPRGMHDVRRLVRRLHEDEGRTILMSSHLLHEIEDVCTRVGIVREGRVVAEGRLRDFVKDAVGGTLLVRSTPADAARRVLEGLVGAASVEPCDDDAFELTGCGIPAPDVARALLEAGCALHALVPERATLEEIFFARHQEVAP